MKEINFCEADKTLELSWTRVTKEQWNKFEWNVEDSSLKIIQWWN